MIIICFCVSMSDPNNKKDDYFSVFLCLTLKVKKNDLFMLFIFFSPVQLKPSLLVSAPPLVK